jgi:two-component system, LuxR family, sensor kinase FixL
MTLEAHGAKRSAEPLDLQALIETIPALVVCTVPDGSAEFANRAWQEYTGLPLNELAGLGWQTTIHPDDLAKFSGEFPADLASGELFEREARIRGADGEYHWFSIRKSQIVWRNPKNESALRALIACEDIDERKQQESARRYIEARYRVMVEAASDAVVCIDENGVILLANPATTKIFGYASADLIGKPLTTLMPEYLRKLHEDGFRRYLATGQRHINWHGTELTGLRKDGQEFPVEISFGEVTADGLQVFTGFIRDITERKQAEELRSSLHTIQLELARVSRLTTMGELAASIAHEVNQPLTAVANNASACLRLLARGNLEPEVLRRALEEIVADGNRASLVIARIRGFVKKAPPTEKSALDINDVIEEVFALARRELSENQVLLEPQLTKTLPLVLGDRIQLQQVLLNLIMNAIEAMTAVTDRPRVLGVRSEVDESGNVLVAVRDSGTGFDSAADQVFAPFFTTKANGMGMGLPISRSLNSPNGAVFSFTVPAAGERP